MGYIKPVHNEQYTQYVNRMIPVTQNLMKVQSPVKSSMDSKLKQHDFYEKLLEKRNQIEKGETGKGLYVNQYV